MWLATSPSTSLIQPLDQGIATIKAYYLRWLMTQLFVATDGEGKPTVKEFRQSYNIKHARQNIKKLCISKEAGFQEVDEENVAEVLLRESL
ncbi:Tigger transposable element-derived protein 1-like 204 [Homarus americanus]|uniref:Tigger transposable element-derived protein 1-like 204 n=1 Tax=Homarus americanus TaxID=6706 RepID=A0A8J5MU96_HOMAM|nr:Tigger transposable element-derived protein 1-like 204 [Homarus americanus]